MKYVALLRGINVGGNAKVSMQALRQMAEEAGLQNVRTYINSGNLLFESSLKKSDVTSTLQKALHKTFGWEIALILYTSEEIAAIAKALPQNWSNDTSMKCDVLFLSDEINNEETLSMLRVKEGIDTAQFTPGAILWAIDRKNATKSGLYKIVGTPLYKKMTVRNCNTLRKLNLLLQD